MEGELELLEQAWREAEELATISDSLLLPASAKEKLAKWKSAEAGSGETGTPTT